LQMFAWGDAWRRLHCMRGGIQAALADYFIH
jgi:hypothetical protein